jgi:hypothetical protein
MAGGDVMAEYHADSRCGSCAGPLEADRDAVCHSCVPQSEFFEMAAEAVEISETLRGIPRWD